MIGIDDVSTTFAPSTAPAPTIVPSVTMQREPTKAPPSTITGQPPGGPRTPPNPPPQPIPDSLLDETGLADPVVMSGFLPLEIHHHVMPVLPPRLVAPSHHRADAQREAQPLAVGTKSKTMGPNW